MHTNVTDIPSSQNGINHAFSSTDSYLRQNLEGSHDM